MSTCVCVSVSRVLAVLEDIGSSSKGVNMARMKTIIRRSVLKNLESLEDHPDYYFAFNIIGDFLFGDNPDQVWRAPKNDRHTIKTNILNTHFTTFGISTYIEFSVVLPLLAFFVYLQLLLLFLLLFHSFQCTLTVSLGYSGFWRNQNLSGLN